MATSFTGPMDSIWRLSSATRRSVASRSSGEGMARASSRMAPVEVMALTAVSTCTSSLPRSTLTSEAAARARSSSEAASATAALASPMVRLRESESASASEARSLRRAAHSTARARRAS